MKKAISAATSAALLASLLATAVAPSAFAAITVGSAGNVPVGGTSANNVSFTFTEQLVNSLTDAKGSFTVAILDNASANTLSFVGTPSTTGSTGSLGVSASAAGNVLTITIAGSDTANKESIFITGLKIKASSVAAVGAIKAALALPVVPPVTNQFGSVGAVATAFAAGGTATGAIVNPIAIGSTSVVVAVTSDIAVCPFSSAGTLAFATSPESVALTTAGAINTPLAGQQVLTIAATASFHAANELVSESTACPASPNLASPGTVVAALKYSSADNATVFPGEFNSPASALTVVEPSAGFLAKDSTFTFKIVTAGVVFSTAPSVGSATTQTITFAGVTANAHAAGTTMTQVQGAPTNCTASGTLVNAVLVGASSALVTPTTSACPFLVTAGTVGPVAFTSNPESGNLLTLSNTVSFIGLSAPVLSTDRLSATVTVNAASTAPATITLSNILYDVAATVPAGTFVEVSLTTSAGKAVNPASGVTNAVVFRGVVAASATSPTVYIGENNQTAGVVSFTESAAGFFTAGVGTGVNTFQICPSGVTYAFTLAPYAQVVGGVAAGNLILRDGSAASTTNIVQGTNLGNGCYGWTVWTASTTASTIKIGNAALAGGALINVTPAQAPGGVNVVLKIGSADFVNLTTAATVQFATAVYRNQVAVTALSQPFIAPGATNAAAGNLQIAETGLGQLKFGEIICVEVLWRSGELQDQFLNSLNTADLPVATATGTGLVIGPVNGSSNRCSGESNALVPAGYMESFTFTVLQQSTAGDGKLVISNIRYTTLTDSAEGPVQLSVWGTGGSPTNVIFHSTVSNAKIGTASALPKLSVGAVSALGLRPTTGYTTKTPKTQVHGKYITWKFTGGTTLAGQRVNVMVAKKVNGAWGGPKYLKSAVADANGIVTFAWRFTSAAAINVRVQWPGSASYGVSTSAALGGYWK